MLQPFYYIITCTRELLIRLFIAFTSQIEVLQAIDKCENEGLLLPTFESQTCTVFHVPPGHGVGIDEDDVVAMPVAVLGDPSAFFSPPPDGVLVFVQTPAKKHIQDPSISPKSLLSSDGGNS